jgi:hypothetical protein
MHAEKNAHSRKKERVYHDNNEGKEWCGDELIEM